MFGGPCMLTMACYPRDATCTYHIYFFPRTHTHMYVRTSRTKIITIHLITWLNKTTRIIDYEPGNEYEPLFFWEALFTSGKFCSRLFSPVYAYHLRTPMMPRSLTYHISFFSPIAYTHPHVQTSLINIMTIHFITWLKKIY